MIQNPFNQPLFSTIHLAILNFTMKHISILLFAIINLCHFGYSQITTIPEIQGTGLTSPYVGLTENVVGVVTGVFNGPGELGGFFLQDVNGDGNSATSDGIFVSDQSGNVAVGDFILIRGDVVESNGQTMITNLINLEGAGQPTSVQPKPVTMPFTSDIDAERYEGMYVTFPQALSTTATDNIGDLGQVVLSTTRLVKPTNEVDPNDIPASGNSYTGASNAATINSLSSLNDFNQMILDDGKLDVWPNPIPYIDQSSNTHRVGSSITDLTGCMDHGPNGYRLQPTEVPTFSFANRPQMPIVGGDITVASFNVAHFWTTLDNGVNGALGADLQEEYDRQLDKLVDAIIELDADILALNELENNGTIAIYALVNAVNIALGGPVYDPVTEPSSTGPQLERNHIIYKPSSVDQIGATQDYGGNVYDSNPIGASFMHNISSEIFSIISCKLSERNCAGATGANEDQEDGQDCFNDRRKQQVENILLSVTELQDSISDNDVLILGDMAAYIQEDPLDMFRANGFFDMIASNYYTSGQDGEWGARNQILANSGMVSQVQDGDVWHINADEPFVIGYNEDFPNQDLYQVDPYRSSDHDPVFVGLHFAPTSVVDNSVKNVRIAPNPTRGEVRFLGSSPERVEVRTIAGQLVYECADSSIISNRLDLSFLNEGIYFFVGFNSDGGSNASRIVIVK